MEIHFWKAVSQVAAAADESETMQSDAQIGICINNVIGGRNLFAELM